MGSDSKGEDVIACGPETGSTGDAKGELGTGLIDLIDHKINANDNEAFAIAA